MCTYAHNKQTSKQMLRTIQKGFERSKTPKFVSLPKPLPAIQERKGQLIKQPGDMVQANTTLSYLWPGKSNDLAFVFISTNDTP